MAAQTKTNTEILARPLLEKTQKHTLNHQISMHLVNAFCAHIANMETGLPAYTTKQFQECNIFNMKPRKALNIDKLITVLLQNANRGK
jgi:hypothetical protein